MSVRSETSAPEVVDRRADRPLPAWPVLVLFSGVLVWWSLGLFAFAAIICAVPMALLLLHRRRVLVAPGVLPWLGFVLWVVPTIVMVEGSGPLTSWAIRLAQFVAVAVIVLYVSNAKELLTPGRLLDSMMIMWASLIAGGYLGVLWPEGSLPLSVGRLLPGAIRGNDYVQDLLFPTFAEIQFPYGADLPFVRPAAPFAYTNGWGAGMAILTLVVVAGLAYHRSRMRLVLAGIALAASVVPVALSTNRGLVVSMGCALLYVFLRLLVRAEWGWVAGLVGGAGSLVALLGVAGFFSGITDRQQVVDTSGGRAGLYAETFTRSLESPLLGYGSPRPSETYEVAVGTQGAVWSVMFCFGFVGLALFLAFLVGVLVRTWDAPTVPALWLHASFVAVIAMSIFYGLDRHLMVFAALAGLLLRERYDETSTFWPRSLRDRARRGPVDA